MSIKSILCVFSGTQGELHILNTALVLAKSYSAHVRVLHITPPPSYPAGATPGDMMDSAMLLETIEKDQEDNLKNAQEFTGHYATLHHVPLGDQEISHHGSAEFIHRKGEYAEIVAQEGRMCDVIVAGRHADTSDILYDDTLLASIFTTGRPVLLVPNTHGILPAVWEDKIISVAWNNGMESARAIFNAMPFLEHADKLHILMVREHNTPHHITAETQVLDYLRRHGVPADAIMINPEGKPVGEALLLKAKELKSDLLVMGAYGHSRFREMILGGTTNHLLRNSTLPLLLSH